MKQKTKKDILIENLLEILDIENEFYKSVDKLIEIQIGDVLTDEQIDIIHRFNRDNFKSLASKKKKSYIKFYNEFNENELADISLFHKSDAGIKLKNKSSELSNINQELLVAALSDANLGILVEKLLSM